MSIAQGADYRLLTTGLRTKKRSSPCGISLRSKNWILVESVFHGETDIFCVEEVFHGASAKTQRAPSSEKIY